MLERYFVFDLALFVELWYSSRKLSTHECDIINIYIFF